MTGIHENEYVQTQNHLLALPLRQFGTLGAFVRNPENKKALKLAFQGFFRRPEIQ